jgi:hypothetical protein
VKKAVILIFFIVLFSSSCSAKVEKLLDFPLEKGTTWVYSYKAYEPSADDPRQIVNANYLLTAKIIDTRIRPPYFIAQVKYEYKLISVDNGWRGLFVGSLPTEKWYVVKDRQVFEENSVDLENIDTKNMSLEYSFPLGVNKRWCQLPGIPCEVVGWREVANQGYYETPADKLDDCYDMHDIYNGGGLFHKFCVGVGIVSKKYDHAGTSFGFEQTLIEYSLGAP